MTGPQEPYGAHPYRSPTHNQRMQDRFAQARNDAVFGGPVRPGSTDWIGNGPVGPGRASGTGRGPDPVHIVSGDNSFFDALRQSLGMSGNDSTNTATNTEAKFPGMEAVIRGQKAIAEATKQVVADMKIAAQATKDLAAQQKSFMDTLKSARQDETKHMANMLDMLVMAQLGGGMGGGGGGMGGGMGGGGHHGHGGFSYTSLGSLRQRAANFMRTQASAVQMNPITNSQGQVTHYQVLQNGQTSTLPANHPSIPGLQKQINRNGHLANMAQGMSYGGVQGMMRSTPYLGTAMVIGDEVNHVANWMTEQTGRNTQFSAMTGGPSFTMGGALSGLTGALGYSSNDRSGIAQRLQQEGFVLGQRFAPGGMTSDMAREAFKGTTSLGYVGDRRNQALDFVSEEYKKLGVSVSESLQLLSVSAKFANSSLGGVASGLRTVTDAAVSTGQNAQVLREQFINQYGNALQSGAGQSAGSLATAFTMATSGISRSFNGMDLGGVLQNRGVMRLLAGSMNQTVGQIESDIGSGNAGPFVHQYQSYLNRNMAQAMSGGVRSQLDSLMQSHGGAQQVGRSSVAQSAIASDLMKNRDWNVDQVRANLQLMGVQGLEGKTDQQIAEFYVANMSGAGVEAQYKQAEDQNKLTPLSSSDSFFKDKGPYSDTWGSGGNQFVKDYQGKIGEYEMKNIGVGDHAAEFFGGTSRSKNTSRAMRTNLDAYKGYQKTSKMANPAIEGLLTKFGDQTDARVQVETAQGPRVVTIDEAIAHFSDQISSGKAVMMGVGDQSGKPVSEATGVRVGGYKTGQDGVQDSTKINPAVGQTVDDYQKSNPQKTAQGGTASTVNVVPSPELRKWLTFMDGNGTNVQGAASNGTPPIPGVR